MMACAVFGTMTSCSDDYEDASKPHVYGETENPPVKGSDANMVTASMKMKQAEAGTEVKIVDLSVYSDNPRHIATAVSASRSSEYVVPTALSNLYPSGGIKIPL